MTRQEKAIKIFRQQFNCSQAVFTAYRDADVLDEASALRLSTVLGAGVACTGSGMCGAASGALLAISMRHGRGDLASVDARGNTYELGRRFLEEFRNRTGSTTCEEILGMNIGTPENLARAREMNLFQTRCLEVVQMASEILEAVLPPLLPEA